MEQQRNNILVFCRGYETKIKIKIQENSRCNCLFASSQRPRDHNENEKTITNIKEIERVRSDELQKLRKQVEVFAYEQQGWARQREEMATKVDHVQGKLITYSNYISALEDCCDKTGFPVAAVKQAALDETELETQTESEDDDTALACNIRPAKPDKDSNKIKRLAKESS